MCLVFQFPFVDLSLLFPGCLGKACGVKSVLSEALGDGAPMILSPWEEAGRLMGMVSRIIVLLIVIIVQFPDFSSRERKNSTFQNSAEHYCFCQCFSLRWFESVFLPV